MVDETTPPTEATPPPVEGKKAPWANALFRTRVRRELARQVKTEQKVGMTRAWGKVAGVTDTVIDAAAAQVAAENPEKFEALGDGTILQGIIKFFRDHREEILAIVKILIGRL